MLSHHIKYVYSWSIQPRWLLGHADSTNPQIDNDNYNLATALSFPSCFLLKHECECECEYPPCLPTCPYLLDTAVLECL